MGETQSLVGIMPWTFIFTICNLLILSAGVKHFLFQPVQKILEQRRLAIATQYEDAAKAQESAKANQAEYETRLASAKEEATDIVKTATVRAETRGEELVNEARAAASVLKAKAEADIENARKKAAGELKQDISGIALAIAGKVVGKEIDANAHNQLIDAFIASVEGAGDAS